MNKVDLFVKAFQKKIDDINKSYSTLVLVVIIIIITLIYIVINITAEKKDRKKIIEIENQIFSLEENTILLRDKIKNYNDKLKLLEKKITDRDLSKLNENIELKKNLDLEIKKIDKELNKAKIDDSKKLAVEYFINRYNESKKENENEKLREAVKLSKTYYKNNKYLLDVINSYSSLYLDYLKKTKKLNEIDLEINKLEETIKNKTRPDSEEINNIINEINTLKISLRKIKTDIRILENEKPVIKEGMLQLPWLSIKFNIKFVLPFIPIAMVVFVLNLLFLYFEILIFMKNHKNQELLDDIISLNPVEIYFPKGKFALHNIKLFIYAVIIALQIAVFAVIKCNYNIIKIGIDSRLLFHLIMISVFCMAVIFAAINLIIVFSYFHCKNNQI